MAKRIIGKVIIRATRKGRDLGYIMPGGTTFTFDPTKAHRLPSHDGREALKRLRRGMARLGESGFAFEMERAP